MKFLNRTQQSVITTIEAMKVAICTFVFFAITYADKLTGNEPVPIINQQSEVGFDGTYHSSFETGNGIVVQEEGSIKNAGNKELEAAEVRGSYTYTAPDGTPIEVNYIADETGFHPEGAHFPVAPTPPPIPPLIARALEWIATHPELVKENSQ